MVLDLVSWGVGAWQTGWEGTNGDGEQFEAEVGTYKCCIPKTFVCTWYKFQKVAERKVHFPSSWTLCSIQIYIHRLHFKISDFQIHNLGCLNLLQLLVLPLVVGRWRITLNLLFYVQVWKKSYQHWEGCDSLMPQGGFGLGFSPCKD
jgi:hypothetical protein